MHHDMKGSFVIATLVIAGSLLPASAAHAHTLDGVLDDYHDVFQGCIDNSDMHVDVNLTNSSLGVNKQHFHGTYNDNDGVEECQDFTWFKRPMFDRPNNNIFAGFGGPNIPDALNCFHSAQVYGVFKKFTGGNWSIVGIGLIYGKKEGSQCTHSYTAAGQGLPSQWYSDDGGNAPWVSVSGGTTSGGTTVVGEIRVAIYSWAHNDTAISHPGNLCADPENCFFNSYLVAW
jgi:hypothetical protein